MKGLNFFSLRIKSIVFKVFKIIVYEYIVPTSMIMMIQLMSSRNKDLLQS